MNLTSQTIDDMLVIRVEDNRIDAAKAIQFKDKMRDLTQNDMPRILLDMTEVLFLDSSGLGAVVAVMKHLNPARRDWFHQQVGHEPEQASRVACGVKEVRVFSLGIVGAPEPMLQERSRGR